MSKMLDEVTRRTDDLIKAAKSMDPRVNQNKTKYSTMSRKTTVDLHLTVGNSYG